MTYDQQDPLLVTLLDESLEADAPATRPPTDLAQRIMALTALDRPLDEALSANLIEPPATMVASILARTRGPAGGPASQSARPGILARLGPTWTRRCRYAAAIVIFAAELGITLSMINIVSDARGFWQMRDELRALARYTGPAAPIDTAIDQLALHLEQPQPHGLQDWPALRDAMSELVADLETLAQQDDEASVY